MALNIQFLSLVQSNQEHPIDKLNVELYISKNFYLFLTNEKFLALKSVRKKLHPHLHKVLHTIHKENHSEVPKVTYHQMIIDKTAILRYITVILKLFGK